MRSPLTRMALVAVFVVTTSGCQTALFSHRIFDPVRPNPNDYREASDDPGSEWDFVGDEGRADQTPVVERDDWWFKKYLMSPRAQSIERNLGFE